MMNENINIKVSRSFLDDTIYCVMATYKKDQTEDLFGWFTCNGIAYVYTNSISRLWGNSAFEDQIKQATCDAIKALKAEHAAKKAYIEETHRLTSIAQEYIKKCGD